PRARCRRGSRGTRPAPVTTTSSTASRPSSSGSRASSTRGSPPAGSARPKRGADAIPIASLISYWQAVVLGLLQGVSELFPVSSLGHSVILPRLLGWNIHQNDSYFLTFLVATHLATAIVLLFFFWRDWVRILRGLGRSLRDREIAPEDVDAKLGLLHEHKLRHIFASPRSAAFFLILNGFLLYGAELLRRRAPQTEADDDARIAKQVTWRGSFLVGAAQALALI